MERNFELLKRTGNRNLEGREAEERGDLDAAARLYEENIKEGYPDPEAFNRLMIIYRKQKKYKDELRVINRGIKVFTQDYDKHRKQVLAGAGNRRQVQQLSTALMQKTGLTDRKGKETYYPEPIGKWMKRREVVEKKVGK